jgi:hypothetical protein
MKKFEYREPRFTVDLPAQFIELNAVFPGRCREISKEGMILELGQPLQLDARGIVALSFQEQSIEIQVRVAHAGTTQSGLEFLYRSDGERNEMARLVASMRGPQHSRAPIALI